MARSAGARGVEVKTGAVVFVKHFGGGTTERADEAFVRRTENLT